VVTCAASCAGSIATCNAYTMVEGVRRVRDCGLLRRCCESLATDPGSTPCCAAAQSLLCFRDAIGGPAPCVFICLPATCCESPCTTDSECDQSFQNCGGSHCVPGCRTVTDYCHNDGTSCGCRPLSPLSGNLTCEAAGPG